MSFLKPHAETPAEPIETPKATVRFAVPDPVRSSLDALHAIAEARERSERVIVSELQRLEDGFIVTMKALEDRVAMLQRENVEIQRRYDSLLKAQLENERHVHTLKELKRVLDSI